MSNSFHVIGLTANDFKPRNRVLYITIKIGSIMFFGEIRSFK